MKKHYKALFLCVFLLSMFLSIRVYAHAGRTGVDGGHIDSETGEYHYHHGYPAHDHEDIDGDGIADCPYDFDDKTGENSGTNSNPSDSISTRQPTKEIATSLDQPIKEPSANKKEEEEVPAWVYWIFAGQAIAIIWLLICNSAKKTDMEIMESSHKLKIDAINKACDEKIAERQATDAELEIVRANIADAKKASVAELEAVRTDISYAQELRKALLDEKIDLLNEIAHQNKEILRLRRLRCCMKDAPLDISFSKTGMPVYWKPNLSKPYGDFTVFVSQKSDIYHTDRYCGGYYAREDHIFNVMGRSKPCKKCAQGFFDFDSVPDWYLCNSNDKTNDLYDSSLRINWRE